MTHTVVHLFAGSGGCTLGFQRAGFRSLGSFDFDARACRDLERLTGGPAFCRDLAAMQPAEMRALTGACPDVVVMSPPCKSFSGCMPAARAGEVRYVDMSQLAVRGVFLALEAWAPALPKIILLENVPRIQTRGAERRHPTITLRCGAWSVSVRASSGAEAVRRLVTAWNADDERRRVAPARVDAGTVLTITSEEGRFLAATIVTGDDASWVDLAASVAARAALFLLTGGRSTGAPK